MIYEMADVVSAESKNYRVAPWFIDLICKEFLIQNFCTFVENADNSSLLESIIAEYATPLKLKQVISNLE